MANKKQTAIAEMGFEQLLTDIGIHLGASISRAIQEGVAEGFRSAKPVGTRAPNAQESRSPEKKALAIKPCLVPSCGREAAARGLCQGHYGKARKLGFNEAQLNAEQLNTLGRDGRKTRFSGQAR